MWNGWALPNPNLDFFLVQISMILMMVFKLTFGNLLTVEMTFFFFCMFLKSISGKTLNLQNRNHWKTAPAAPDFFSKACITYFFVSFGVLFLLCSSRTHYIEYLAKLIHQYKLDPVVIFELNELLQELRRRGKNLPDRSKDATDQLYRDICIKVRKN